MVKNAEDYRWNSVHAHLKGDDPLGIVDAQKLLNICGDWKDYLKQAINENDDKFVQHSSTGRPLGGAEFIGKAEKILNRDLQKKKPGPKVEGIN